MGMRWTVGACDGWWERFDRFDIEYILMYWWFLGVVILHGWRMQIWLRPSLLAKDKTGHLEGVKVQLDWAYPQHLQ